LPSLIFASNAKVSYLRVPYWLGFLLALLANIMQVLKWVSSAKHTSLLHEGVKFCIVRFPGSEIKGIPKWSDQIVYLCRLFQVEVALNQNGAFSWKDESQGAFSLCRHFISGKWHHETYDANKHSDPFILENLLSPDSKFWFI
jgi:hypothetical protein